MKLLGFVAYKKSLDTVSGNGMMIVIVCVSGWVKEYIGEDHERNYVGS